MEPIITGPLFIPKFAASSLNNANDISRSRLELDFLFKLYDDYQAKFERPQSSTTELHRPANGPFHQLEMSFVFRCLSVRDKSQTVSAPMFMYPPQLDRVIKIMYYIAPNPHTVPWRNITSIELQSMHLLEDIFELAIFLPQLKTFKSKLVLPPNTPLLKHPAIDNQQMQYMDPNRAAGRDSVLFPLDEYLDMSGYEMALRNHYKPLKKSLVSKLRLNYEIIGSAISLRSTERLCRWYFPKLHDYRIESGFHEVTNGQWTCRAQEFCYFHSNF